MSCCARLNLTSTMSSALQRQLHPLLWDAVRNEPFLRLPEPLSHIIITPPRPSDAEEMIGPLNDPRVFNGLQSPPWPFTPENGAAWTGKLMVAWHEQLKQLEDIAAQGEDAPLSPIGFCPVRCLRDATTEKQTFLGDFQLARVRFDWEANEEKRRELVEANEALPAADPAIVYTIGCKEHP